MPHVSRPGSADAPSDWDTAHHVWDTFVERHPELRYPRGRWGFHNFTRIFRARLVDADAIRLARNRFWVAHRGRFPAVAFDLATSYAPRRAGETTVTRTTAHCARNDEAARPPASFCVAGEAAK
jgi:hypothetical protein